MSGRSVWLALLCVLSGSASAAAPKLVVTRAERALARHLDSPVEHDDPVGKGSTRPENLRILTLANGSRWVFKATGDPKRNVLAAMHFLRPDTHVIRERSTYVTSRFFKLGVVRKTAAVEWNGKPGSLQAWDPGAMTTDDDLAPGTAADAYAVEAIAVLHYVVQATDGHPNMMARRVGPRRAQRLSAIDNEVTFSGESIPRGQSGPMWAFRGQPLSPRMARRLASVDVEAWKAALADEGLTPREIEPAVRRFEQLRTTGFPSW
jgi:hypothetical protein